MFVTPGTFCFCWELCDGSYCLPLLVVWCLFQPDVVGMTDHVSLAFLAFPNAHTQWCSRAVAGSWGESVVHPEPLLSASALREQWECRMPMPRSYRCFGPQEISLWENVPNEDIESMSKYEAHTLSEMGMSFLLEGQTLGFQCLASPLTTSRRNPASYEAFHSERSSPTRLLVDFLSCLSSHKVLELGVLYFKPRTVNSWRSVVIRETF